MKKKIILGVVAFIIIVVATLGVLYFTTDLFKTPEQLFYKYFIANYDLLEKQNYEEALAELEEPLESSGEITAKVISDDTQMDALAEILEKGKIAYNAKMIGKEQKMQYDLTLNYNNNDIIALNVLNNNEEYGIKVEELYDKYISVENNNLKALFQKLGVDTTDIPDKIEMVDYRELLEIDENTMNHIKTTYSDVIKQSIAKECYSIEKDVNVKIDDANVMTNAYKLTLTEEQVQVIFVKFFETLKTDDVTLDLIVEKYNMMATTYEQVEEIETITKQELVEQIQEELDDMNQSEVTSDKALEIIVYAVTDNKAKFEIVAEDRGEVAVTAEIDLVKVEDSNKMIVTCNAEDSEIVLETSYNQTEAEVIASVTSEGTTIELTMTEKEKDNTNVAIEDFTTENSVKLNDMTEQEITTLVQTIYNNVIKVLPTKMQLLGIDLTGQV